MLLLLLGDLLRGSNLVWVVDLGKIRRKALVLWMVLKDRRCPRGPVIGGILLLLEGWRLRLRNRC